MKSFKGPHYRVRSSGVANSPVLVVLYVGAKRIRTVFKSLSYDEASAEAARLEAALPTA